MSGVMTRRLISVLSVCAILAYCVASPRWDLAALSIAIGGLALVVRKGREVAVLPRPLINLALGGVLIAALAQAVNEGLDVDAFCVFLSLLVLVKLFDTARPRDDAQLITLGVFLAIGAILTSNKLAVAVVLLAFYVMMVAAVIRHQIRSVEHAAGAARRALGVERRPPAVALRPIVRFGVAAGLFGAIVGVVVFVVLPRELGDRVFGDFRNASLGSVTGFSDRVQLGVEGLISESPAIVLDMTVRDQAGAVLGGNGQTYYLRGAVLTAYERGAWVRSDGTAVSTSRVGGNVFERLGDPRTATLEQEITIRSAPRGETYLFTVWSPVGLTLGQTSEIIRSRGDDIVLRRSGRPGRFLYTVRSQETPTLPIGARPTATGEVAFDSPEIEARAREVVGDWRAEMPDGGWDPAVVERAARRLEASFLTFAYTLSPGAPPRGMDPIEWFLFESQSGHCEYFASAMVAMCRSVGINARVVTGYVATEFNETSRHYVVRESNAHAWVEVETSLGLWRTFDPTPPADLARVHQVSESLVARTGRLIDAIEYLWIRAVVAFDEDSRQGLLGGLAPSARRVEARLSRTGEALVRDGRSIMARAALVGVVTFFVTLGVGGALLVGWRRLVLGRRGRSGDVPAYYAELLKRWSRDGIPKPVSRPPGEHARIALTPGGPRLVELLYRDRFGGGLSEAERGEAAMLARALRPARGSEKA